MATPSVFVLGGYGSVGKAAAGRLLAATGAHLVIAGRRLDEAEAMAASLSVHHPGRVHALAVDANDGAALGRAVAGSAVLFDCSPTAVPIQPIARAALDAGCDYLDVRPSHTLAALRSLQEEVVSRGRVFLTQAGLHPGMSAALMRLAHARRGSLDSVATGMLLQPPPGVRAKSLIELIEIMGEFDRRVWKDGAWRKAPWSEVRAFEFGEGFGVRKCWPVYLDELQGIPETTGAREVGSYVGGFNWFVDLVVTPVALGLAAIRRGLGARMLAPMMAWGINRFARAPYGVVIALEARGADGGTMQLAVRSDDDDGYQLTAIPCVAAILQLLDDKDARNPGVYPMGQWIEPERFLRDLTRMGVKVVES